jgi:hypothetical protein
MTKLSRRDAANIAVWRQGLPTTQAGVDAMWSGVVGKINATIPASPTHFSLSSHARTSAGEQRAVDWTSIATGLNAEADLTR